jgi:hypothetical protein
MIDEIIRTLIPVFLLAAIAILITVGGDIFGE